ncbi:DUF4190 domain-containing protein [Leucobacter sp.]
MTSAALTPDTTALAAQADDTTRIPRIEQPADAANGSGRPAQFAGPTGAPVAEDARGFAITSFVLGIASVVSGWTFIAPITGLILGIIALRRRTTERTLALWGVWLNGVMLALTVLAALVVLSLLVFGFFTIPFLAA